METETLLRLKDLTKTYKGSHLGRTMLSRGVEDLNLEIKQGEVFGLLGLNGSGKTTTIKLILGLLHPTKGHVEMFGRTMPHPDAQKQIGYLPEVPYFYRNLTPVEVLHLYASISQLPSHAIAERIEHVLSLVQMEPYRTKPMREFSKGMLQRIGLAQALIHDPQMLILDEPVTGLDPLGIRQTRQLLVDLNKKGKTIFFSSHSISELERLSHRVGVLVKGRLARLFDQSEWKEKQGRLEELFVEILETAP